MPSPTNPVATESVLLSSVRDRCVCRVSDFDLLPDDASRLKNMGICVGRRIELLQVGDPLIINVSGANVGVARRLAVGIKVRLETDQRDQQWLRQPLQNDQDQAPETVAIA